MGPAGTSRGGTRGIIVLRALRIPEELFISINIIGNDNNDDADYFSIYLFPAHVLLAHGGIQ